MSGWFSSIVRMASSSSAGRPSAIPGAVRYQYSSLAFAPGWSACRRNVFSKPRRSRVRRRNGTALALSLLDLHLWFGGGLRFLRRRFGFWLRLCGGLGLGCLLWRRLGLAGGGLRLGLRRELDRR